MSIQIATVRDLQSAEHLKSVALGERDHEKALPLWRAARQLDPDSMTLIVHQALALHQLGQHRKLVDLVTPFLADNGRLSHLLNVYAASLCQLDLLREAHALLRHILTLDPDYPNVRGSIESIRANMGRSAKPSPAIRIAVERCIERALEQSRPTLSVCMIVKDEAEFIEGAVGSVKGVADQVVVVDTGSSDDTVELARAAGAQVEFFPWTGDFSAARNASLDAATSDWVLVLDADERLTESSRTTLRAILEEYRDEDDLRVVCVKINNYTRDGRFINDGFSGRLFRRHPVMRFDGRVHEEVARGRNDVSTDYRLDLAFDHYGADPEVMREKAKDDRNLALLESRLAEAPDDLLTWFYVASQHWVGGRREEALDAFARVLELYDRDPSGYGVGIRNVPVAYSYVGLVRGHLNVGRIEEASKVALRGEARFPENPDILFHSGLVSVQQGELQEARDLFARAAGTTLSGYALIGMNDKSITAWRAPKMVADIDFQLEEHQMAYDGYLAVLDALPDEFDEWHVVTARLVELASTLKDYEQLPSHTIRYLKRRPDQIAVGVQVAQQLAGASGLQGAYDLLTTLFNEIEGLRSDLQLIVAIGQVAEQAGDDQEALSWYERAVNLKINDPNFWLNLAQLFARNGEAESAQEALRVAQGYLAP